MTEASPRKAASVEEIVELYERLGPQRYDEEVSQLAHAVQTAERARERGAPPELVVAALLHDVGHLLEMDRRGSLEFAGDDDHHEATGARYLAGLFPPAVTGPIALHVRAKRYLCATEPDYFDRLSDGSKQSLAVQGGPMTADEAAAFRELPQWAEAVEVRRCDDEGKVLGIVPAGIDEYVPLMERSRHRG